MYSVGAIADRFGAGCDWAFTDCVAAVCAVDMGVSVSAPFCGGGGCGGILMAGRTGTARGVIGLKAGATGDAGMLWFCMMAPAGSWSTGASGGGFGGAEDLLVVEGDDRRGEVVSEGIRALRGASKGAGILLCPTFALFLLDE